MQKFDCRLKLPNHNLRTCSYIPGGLRLSKAELPRNGRVCRLLLRRPPGNARQLAGALDTGNTHVNGGHALHSRGNARRHAR